MLIFVSNPMKQNRETLRRDLKTTKYHLLIIRTKKVKSSDDFSCGYVKQWHLHGEQNQTKAKAKNKGHDLLAWFMSFADTYVAIIDIRIMQGRSRNSLDLHR